MKILIVEDNPVNVDVLHGALEGAGYEIFMAPSGEVAVKLAPQIKPDLILLDVMMPGMDGFETCRHFKKTPDLKNIPIIFVTGKTETRDIVEGFHAGGADYINKPFRHEEVLARVATQLNLRRANRKNDALVADLKHALVKMEDAQLEALAKTQFLGRMTHELRTPMTAILGFSELLVKNSQGHLDERELDLVEEVLKAGKHLMQLIGRVLDYSELEEKDYKFDTEAVPLSRLVHESVQNYKHPPGYAVDIRESFNGFEGKNVLAHPEKLREIVDILLDNAVKYGEKTGMVSIECNALPSGRIQLAVVDEGATIPEAERKKIFLPLYRMQQHMDMVDGIGMGLACARKYAGLMDASLDVEPGPDGGNKFNLEMKDHEASQQE